MPTFNPPSAIRFVRKPSIQFNIQAMFDSIDELEDLLKLRKIVTNGGYFYPRCNHDAHPEVPVPNPLGPSQPHLIESDEPVFRVSAENDQFGANNSLDAFSCEPIPATAVAMTSVVISVPDPLKMPILGSSETLPSSAATKPSTRVPTQRRREFPTHASQICAPIVTSAPSIKTRSSSFIFAMTASSATTMTSSLVPSIGSPAPLVRTKKIKNTLHSRPQRGKKRRNLNVSKGLDLAQTPNR